jgi:hypothetical protein
MNTSTEKKIVFDCYFKYSGTYRELIFENVPQPSDYDHVEYLIDDANSCTSFFKARNNDWREDIFHILIGHYE